MLRPSQCGASLSARSDAGADLRSTGHRNIDHSREYALGWRSLRRVAVPGQRRHRGHLSPPGHLAKRAHAPTMTGAPAGPGKVERWIGGRVRNNPGFVRRLAGLESRFFRAELDAIEIDRPIYISGLARAGTTIVLEALAAHRELASHRYRDFPLGAAPL